MTDLWLSRARLRRTASVSTLAPLLLPDQEHNRVSTGHRLIWSLSARDGVSAERDFLWREDADGVFYTLSSRPPPLEHPLFEVDPPKAFAPELAPGDRLRFALRANPTVSRSLDSLRIVNRDPNAVPRRRTAHDDVVMRELHSLPREARAEARVAAIASAGRRWLGAQASKKGFMLTTGTSDHGDSPEYPLCIDRYRVLSAPKRGGAAPMRIALLDFEGILVVTDPIRFLTALKEGIGRAKAFGCGLMLIARA
jgi:CRISPR system Cascade subunit CasE